MNGAHERIIARGLVTFAAMRRLAIGFAIVLFAALAFAQDRPVSAKSACEVCEAPFHKVITAPETFIKGAQVTPMPSLDGYYPAGLADQPMILDIVVDASGVPCSVKVRKNGDDKVLAKLRIALKSWKFKTPKYNGNAICLSSQLLVYARSKGGNPTLFIPGVSDRDAK